MEYECIFAVWDLTSGTASFRPITEGRKEVEGENEVRREAGLPPV